MDTVKTYGIEGLNWWKFPSVWEQEMTPTILNIEKRKLTHQRSHSYIQHFKFKAVLV